MLHLLYLFFLVAGFLAGWLLGLRYHKKKQVDAADKIYGAYCKGMNFLLNEQPDKAIDAFIKMLEVTGDTVETHLALGNLFRRKGEVDRAIRIHQNLIARPQLEKSQRVQAISELAQDYLRAGFLDRAERLFLELITIKAEKQNTYESLLNIYEQQKEWQQAIALAQQIELNYKTSMSLQIGQYYCELSDIALSNGLLQQAYSYIFKALAINKNCVRAYLVLGKLESAAQKYDMAIAAYKNIKEADPDFISEIVSPLAHCYSKLESADSYMEYLRECLAEFPRISIVLSLSEYLRETSGDKGAIEFIAEQIRHVPSLRGLSRLIELYINNVDVTTRERLILLKDIIEKLLEKRPVYRCIHCGFSGKQLYWQCPSCRSWSCVKPIHGLEGD